ncbi:MAG: hypothetical protein JKY54_19320 [Flavobacteriales bacterium]|nr:hypothetical protein [Flavobacteriales bacterium]
MKFLKTEHESIKRLIEESNHDYASFSFIKRKGRLHIYYKNQEPSLSFYRKKETSIDASGFTERTLFDLQTDVKKGTVGKWDDVLKVVQVWLDSIP